jgi:hypothetical protein
MHASRSTKLQVRHVRGPIISELINIIRLIYRLIDPDVSCKANRLKNNKHVSMTNLSEIFKTPQTVLALV